jgi:hypothetical protein
MFGPSRPRRGEERLTFVTGRPTDIAILLKALDASAPVRGEDHTAVALIGNVRRILGAAHTGWIQQR